MRWSLGRWSCPHVAWRRRRNRCACILTCLRDIGNGGFRRWDGIGTRGHVGGRRGVLAGVLRGRVLSGLLLRGVGGRGGVLARLFLGRAGESQPLPPPLLRNSLARTLPS